MRYFAMMLALLVACSSPTVPFVCEGGEDLVLDTEDYAVLDAYYVKHQYATCRPLQVIFTDDGIKFLYVCNPCALWERNDQ